MWSSFHYHTLIRAALKSTSSRTAVHAKMFLKAIEKVNLNEQACGFFGVFFIRFLLRLHALVSSIVVDHSYCKNRETINAAFRLGRHESGYFFKKKTRTNRNKNERIKKMSGFTGFGWTEGRYNENMRFQKHPDSSGRSFREGCQ